MSHYLPLVASLPNPLLPLNIFLLTSHNNVQQISPANLVAVAPVGANGHSEPGEPTEESVPRVKVTPSG